MRYLPKSPLTLFKSHSTPLTNEGLISRTSQNNLISVSKAFSTSSLSSSISDSECTGAKSVQNALLSFNRSQRQRMMGNKCLLRKCNWSGRSALTAVIEVLRSLSASTVGMSPCTLVLFRKGNTTVSINCCALRSGEDSDGPGCMERWKRNIVKSYMAMH